MGRLVIAGVLLVALPFTLALAGSPEDLAREIERRFGGGAHAAFDELFPFPDGQDMVRIASERNLGRRSGGLARCVWQDGDAAVVVLGGHLVFGNSGDETINSESFSGLYEARRTDEADWQLVRRVPLEELGTVSDQELEVELRPGAGLDVFARLTASVMTPYGLALRLNHAVRLTEVRADDQPVIHAFGGGLLWLDVEPADRVRIEIAYVVDVARDADADANSGRFEESYGHVRNQYYWHPRGLGAGRFALTVRAPAAWYVATDLEQRESVENDVRIVRARTREPVEALSLFYDRGWRPVVRRSSGLQLAIFATPDFEPRAAEIEAEFKWTFDRLRRRFGTPSGGSIAVVQGRARDGAGWLFRSNDAIATPVSGGVLMRAGSEPRAFFGHEVAHGWTHPTGPAANFLREGWATFAEAILLGARHGPETVQVFWESQRRLYEEGGYEGQSSILDDPFNSGVAYSKGAWVLRGLEYAVGTEAFDAGLRSFMRIPPGQQAGLEQFVEVMSTASRRDVAAFLAPWLEEKVLPVFSARIEARRVVIVQSGPLFQLPLEVELLTTDGVTRRTIEVHGTEQVLDVSELPPVQSVQIDPDRHFLTRRVE